MAEWTIATVCKTVARKGSAGSNPALGTLRKVKGPGGSVVERVLGKDEVAGSIPALGSNLPKRSCSLTFGERK